MSYNSGVIVLVISNRPRATRSADYSLNCTLLSAIIITNKTMESKSNCVWPVPGSEIVGKEINAKRTWEKN